MKNRIDVYIELEVSWEKCEYVYVWPLRHLDWKKHKEWKKSTVGIGGLSGEGFNIEDEANILKGLPYAIDEVLKEIY